MAIVSRVRILLLALVAAACWLQGCGAMAGAGRGGDTVLVAGATGKTGRLIAQDLSANGFRVRALVRDVSKAKEVLGENLEFAVGDVRDRKSIDVALKGVRYVVSAIGATRNEPANAPEFVDYGGTKNLADAAAAAKVRQIVIVSSSGVTQEDHILNRLFNNVMLWKFKGEEAVRGSGVAYTVIRPGGLTDDAVGKKPVTFAQGDKSTGTVSRADVAVACREALRIPAARNRTFELFSNSNAPATDWQKLYAALKPDQPASGTP
jgi:uncharacterized protein YbjT (DUF2867 family)